MLEVMLYLGSSITSSIVKMRVGQRVPTEIKVRENRARRAARRQGLTLRKARARDPRALDHGRYWLTGDTGTPLVGGRVGMDLGIIEAALARPSEEAGQPPLGVPLPEVDPLMSTCIHEAGHAVAAVHTGATVELASVRPGPASAGRVRILPSPWGAATAEDLALVSYAGVWAEHRKQWDGRDLTARDTEGLTLTEHVEMGLLEQTDHHGKQDFHAVIKAETRMLTGGGRGRRELALTRAARPAVLEYLWPAIEDVAGELYRHRTMGHDAVEQVMVEQLGPNWLVYRHLLEWDGMEDRQSLARAMLT